MLQQQTGRFATLTVLLCLTVARSHGHDGLGPHFHVEDDRHHQQTAAGEAKTNSDNLQPKVTLVNTVAPVEVDGQGDWQFRYRPDLSKVPVEPSVLHRAHGGLEVNRRAPADRRSTYFGLPVAGVLEVSADLKTIVVKGGSKELFNPNPGPKSPHWNYHETAMVYHAGRAYLGLPSDNAHKIWFTTLDGEVVTTLQDPPKASGKKPTGLLQVPESGVVKIFFGYSDRKISEADPFGGPGGRGVWNPLVFGGKGTYEQLELFSTDHHAVVYPTGSHMVVADREYGRFQHLGFDGKLVEPQVWDLKVPGSHVDDLLHPNPCGMDFGPNGDVAVVGNLKGHKGEVVEILDTRSGKRTRTDRPSTFQILEVATGEVLSTVSPWKLGVADSHHIHSVVIRYVGNRVYVIVLFWNPGGYAVFERIQLLG